jgi:site-specific DNA recombinase
MLLDAYVRVSRKGKRKTQEEIEADGTLDESARLLVSPELQTSKIDRWANGHDHQLVYHEPEIDVSGSKMQRKILDKIIQRIKNGETEGIIVAKLNRFARTLIGGLQVIKEIEEAGGVFVAVDQDFDTSTPMGKTILVLMLRLAEQELEERREGWTEAQSRAIGNHVWMNPHIPIGYERTMPEKSLILSADAPHVRKAFKMRGTGSAVADIERYLAKHCPLEHDRIWTYKRVIDLFPKRVYRGETRHGDILNPESHEAIVTEAEWQAANAIPKRTVSRTSNPSLLHGLIRCAGCGYIMSPSSVPQRPLKDGTQKPNLLIYTCRRVHQKKKCPAPSMIVRHLADEYVEQAWREGMAGLTLEGSEATEEFDTAQDELDALEAELAEHLADTGLRAAVGAQRYRSATETRLKAIADVRARLVTLSAKASTNGSANAFSYDDLTLDERHDVLAGSVDVILCRRAPKGTTAPDRLRILWRGDAKDDMTFPATW